jgi:radical SAM superfamily enzyme YgiQ (UPF0313 family)
VKDIIEELKEIVVQYKPKGFRFEDDVFVIDKKWFKEFKEAYVKEVHLPFHCYITPSGVNEQVVYGLKECGCESIAMGVQSGNEELRRSIMNRNYSNNKVIEASQLIKKAGIKLYAEYMFGFPNENPEKMHETLLLSDKVNANNSWAGIFYPYPKVELTEFCLSKNYIDEFVYKDILLGKGSPHTASLLNIEHKDEALRYKTILPLYSVSPKWIKYLLRRLLKYKYNWIYRMIYVFSIPLLEKKEFLLRAIRLPIILYKTNKILKK